MKITLIAIGTKMPRWVNEAYTEYAKRLPPELSIHLIEIPAIKRSKDSHLERLIEQEGTHMLHAIPQGDYVVALHERGKMWDTFSFSKQLHAWQQMGRGLTLLIGGPEGLTQTCLHRADLQWSLSPLTWPHPMVRVMVAEQLYRAWSVLSNHPYHR